MQKESVVPTELLPSNLEVRPTSPVLAVGLGRGFSGKSTLLSELVWRAKNQGRDVIVADGDLRSRTLANLFPNEAIVPETEELPNVKTWLSKVLNEMVKSNRSAVLDLGSNDRLLQEYGQDMKLTNFCGKQGVQSLAIYLLGPEKEDLQHVLAIWKTGHFQASRTMIMLNEGVIRQGQTVIGAFGWILDDPEFQEMAKGVNAKTFLLNRLACMETVKKTGLGFYGAVSTNTLDPVEQFMTESWLNDLEKKRYKCPDFRDCLP